jgi:hypothetical protein
MEIYKTSGYPVLKRNLSEITFKKDDFDDLGIIYFMQAHLPVGLIA